MLGELAIGEARATRLIKQVVRQINGSRLSVLDGPPGNSCAAVAAIEPADHVVVVMEASPFGVHDMRQTVQVVRQLQRPWSLVVNKETDSDWTDRVLRTEGLAPVVRIPLRRTFFAAAQRGDIFLGSLPEVCRAFEGWFVREGWR